MASLQGLMHNNTTALYGNDIASFMADLNTSLCERTTTERYVTVFFGIIDATGLTLDYVNAGHNPPLLLRSGHTQPQSIVLLDHGGIPAGIFPHRRYECCRVDLTVGDVLVMYTDGLTEAQNALGEEFGSQRLSQAVTDVLSLPANAICRRVNQKLKDFAGDGAQQDDITIVVMKVLSSS